MHDKTLVDRGASYTSGTTTAKNGPTAGHVLW